MKFLYGKNIITAIISVLLISVIAVPVYALAVDEVDEADAFYGSLESDEIPMSAPAIDWTQQEQSAQAQSGNDNTLIWIVIGIAVIMILCITCLVLNRMIHPIK